MARIIGIQFKKGGKVYSFDPGELEVAEGDGVIVETARGVEFGDVVQGPRDVPEEQIVTPLKQVQRIATPQDREARDRNRAREKEAYLLALDKIQSHKLDMKLVDVEYTFNGSKIVFYFTADGRVDFRELVKDLAGIFKTRIELRQIGVRDEAKMIGGLGSCGRPVCCKAFLADFQPVSIKMAKEQNLSLSPTKISGICGRLMCCLKYEQDCYESMRKQMPRTGRETHTPDGMGVVLENNVITEKTRVKITLQDGSIDVREYPFRELSGSHPLPTEAAIPSTAPAAALDDAGCKTDEENAQKGPVPEDSPVRRELAGMIPEELLKESEAAEPEQAEAAPAPAPTPTSARKDNPPRSRDNPPRRNDTRRDSPHGGSRNNGGQNNGRNNNNQNSGGQNNGRSNSNQNSDSQNNGRSNNNQNNGGQNSGGNRNRNRSSYRGRNNGPRRDVQKSGETPAQQTENSPSRPESDK